MTTFFRSTFTGANQTVARIDLDPECRHVLGACYDNAVRLWSVDDQRQRMVFTGHTDKVSSAKFFQSGRQIVSGSNDRTIKTFDLHTSRCIRTYFAGSITLDVAVNDRVGAPVFSSHYDRKVRFWDTRDPEPCKTLDTQAKVTSLCVAPGMFSHLPKKQFYSNIFRRFWSFIHVSR